MQLVWIIFGAISGVIVGTFFPTVGIKVGFLGDLFLNALKMMVMPIVITSLIVGVTNLRDIQKLGSLGMRTIIYYMCTTAISVVIGLLFVCWIQPGVGGVSFGGELPQHIADKQGSFSMMEVLLGIVHPNLFEAAADFKIMPLIFISIVFGIALAKLGDKSEPAVKVFRSLNEAVMLIVFGIMYFAPIGIFGLIAERLGITGGGEAVLVVLSNLAEYCMTVIAGLLAHGVIVLPLLYFIFKRANPFKYLVQMSKAMVTALATSSSSATLPLTMECATKESDVSEETASVVLPLGATINMDGTALYEAVAAVFIAQSYGITLGIPELLIIVLTATCASIGAAGIPEAGLVTMVLVLESVGLPIEGIGLILAVDWFLDRCRTTVNVWGDSVGAAIVDQKVSRGKA